MKTFVFKLLIEMMAMLYGIVIGTIAVCFMFLKMHKPSKANIINSVVLACVIFHDLIS